MKVTAYWTAYNEIDNRIYDAHPCLITSRMPRIGWVVSPLYADHQPRLHKCK